MTIEVNGETLYSPSETARKLGISVGMLRYHRNAGNIKGFDMGTTTYYSQPQIESADLERKKPGPKSAGKQDEDDKQEGRDTTVMLGMSRNAARLVGVAS